MLETAALKALYLTRVWVFLFIFGDHMLMGLKYGNQVSPYISAWRCGFSSAKLVHQKSKLVMLLSQA